MGEIQSQENIKDAGPTREIKEGRGVALSSGAQVHTLATNSVSGQHVQKPCYSATA